MLYANKLLYIGTGLHIDPVLHFKETKKFIFIDTQPRSEFDTPNKFTYIFYRKQFIIDLEIKLSTYGFILDKCIVLQKKYYKNLFTFIQRLYYAFTRPPLINPTLLVFTNKRTKQTIKYYVSTNIEYNMTDKIKKDISTCDGLIVSGYIPMICLLDYITSPIKFFGYTKTCYSIPEENTFDKEKDDTIIYFLHNNKCSIIYYFKEFYVVNDETSEIIQTENFEECKNIAHYRYDALV